MRTDSLAFLFCLLTLGASCGDDPKKKIDETCGADFECASGLCLEGRCLAPEADEDEDGLTNRVEGEVGSNALLDDSDLDGVPDFDEFGTSTVAKDFDGDGFADVVESASADLDNDCIPNQRDAANDIVESDSAVVADRACCCQGLCGGVGVSATATCNGGELTCNPAQPDRDGDGTADACDTPLLALASSDVEDGCAAACTTINTNCVGQLPGCSAECVARASDEGMWLANYACFAAECSDVRCFDDADFSEEATCREACINAVGCEVAAFLGDADLTEPRCRAQCAGQYQANDDGVAALACLSSIEVPEDGCDLVDALPCVLGDQLCSDGCEKLAFPPSDATCRIGAPAYAGFATDALCTSGCTDLPGYGEVSFLGCSALKGCSNFAATCAVDAAPKEGCAAACSALATACPVPNGAFANASLCEAFCTGLGLAAPWLEPADAVACITTTQGCDTNEETLQTLTRCALTASPEPRCVTACEAITDCAEELQEPAPPECVLGCSGLVINHPERIEPTLTCVAGSASCTETSNCIPPAPDDMCTPACMHRLGCDPNYLGGQAQCVTDCKADIAADLDNVAAWMCESQARGCDTNCGELPGLVPDAGCVSACAGKDTCIEAAYGVCTRACQGVRRAYGDGTSNTCITDQLGRRCDAVAVRACGGT